MRRAGLSSRAMHSRLYAACALGAALSLLSGCPNTPPQPQPGPKPTAEPEPPAHPVPTTQAQLAEYGLEHIGVDVPDVCEKNPDGTIKDAIPEGMYTGLLRNAKCDQQKFITMAQIAGALGVKCNHCHAPLPSDPKKEDFPKFTENKRRANWMFKTFIQGLRPVDGKKMMCANCHVDRQTKKPLVKILHDPRDRDHAQEWMHEVMTTQFVEQNGKRLKCKTCHVGMAPDTDGWIKDVIRRLVYKGDMQRRPDTANDFGE
jgi:hypothetical protein